MQSYSWKLFKITLGLIWLKSLLSFHKYFVKFCLVKIFFYENLWKARYGHTKKEFLTRLPYCNIITEIFLESDYKLHPWYNDIGISLSLLWVSQLFVHAVKDLIYFTARNSKATSKSFFSDSIISWRNIKNRQINFLSNYSYYLIKFFFIGLHFDD